MIKQISFKHGWFYHYRLHSKKISCLDPSLNALKIYLDDVYENCPHEHFESGPRGSSLKFQMNAPMLEIDGHEVSSLTNVGLDVNFERYKTNHSRVQVYMLEYDAKTLAVEVPIWIHPSEMEGFQKIFGENLPLTGHIDVLRVEGDKVWVWDYKPNAHKEKYASTQVYFYSLMLSQRTGIPIDRFMCGYFDESKAFIFRPEKQLLNNLIN